MGCRLAGRKALRGFSKPLGLDRAVYPAVKDINDRRARLQALGPHRPASIRSYVRTSIHSRLHQDTARAGRFRSRVAGQRWSKPEPHRIAAGPLGSRAYSHQSWKAGPPIEGRVNLGGCTVDVAPDHVPRQTSRPHRQAPLPQPHLPRHLPLSVTIATCCPSQARRTAEARAKPVAGG
jgi:hypothetical protein